MKKRTFLFSGLGLAGALMVGWSVMPARARLNGKNPLPPIAGQLALNGWARVAADDTVTVIMGKSEMGQGVHTALAMMLAEELDCDWQKVRIEHSPIDPIYNNIASMVDGLPFHPDDHGAVKRSAQWMVGKLMREFGVMMTGGSASVKDLWSPMRDAGAMARASLLNAGAKRLGVDAAQCTVENGVISAGSKRINFGELVAAVNKEGASLTPASSWTLKDPTKYKLLGKPQSRIDSVAKTDGSAKFGIDSQPPGCLFAAVTMSPTLGGSVRKCDSSKSESMPGVKKVLTLAGTHGASGAVAIIADQYWRARKALAALVIEWDTGPAAALSSADIDSQFTKALDSGKEFDFFKQGDADKQLTAAARKIEAVYRAPYLAHAPMEPMNCTVHLRDGKAQVWVSTQVAGPARDAVAKVLNLASENVQVHVQYLGGGFGRRLDVDFIAQAALIARESGGAPVQTIWSREEDMRHDFYRPAAVSRFRAGFDATDKLQGWVNVSAGQAIQPQYLPRALGWPAAGPDKTTSEGSFDQPYEFEHARIGHVTLELPIPVGFWRAVGHSHQAFFKESFVDEAANEAKMDPVAFRASLLLKHPRHLAVLKLAAEKSGWGQALAPAADGAKKARGIALHESFGTIVAEVLEVSIDKEKNIRVHRVVCALDCGFAVNPNIIRQQIESAVIFGLSAALYGEITLDKGQVQQSNYHDYAMLRFNEAPVIETHIIASQSHPEGIGEPGLPPVAPALANALFALNGQRLRSLPLKLPA